MAGPRESHAVKLLRYGIEAVISTLIVLVLASIWWPRRVASPPAQAIAVKPMLQQPAGTTTALISAHLFGEARLTSNTVAVSPASITVDGIVYASSAANSQALLTLNGKANLYKVGDMLPDGEQVTAIDAARIELSGAGAIRKIAMQTYGSTGSEGPAAYAALLRGAGLSHSLADSAAPRDADASPTPSSPFFTPARLPMLHPTVTARAVRIEARATPLEQLRSLRSQLIR